MKFFKAFYLILAFALTQSQSCAVAPAPASEPTPSTSYITLFGKKEAVRLAHLEKNDPVEAKKLKDELLSRKPAENPETFTQAAAVCSILSFLSTP